MFGKYLHVFWIPFFPIGKKIFSECTHCKKTIEKDEFPQDLKSKYEERKDSVKRPFYHWAGLILVGVLITVGIVGAAMVKDDARAQLLKADIEKMTNEPGEDQFVVSLIKITLSGGSPILGDNDPDKFLYFSSTKENKVLILVKIPDLKDVTKENRKLIVETIEGMASALDESKGRKIYIGLMGKFNMMVVKTPTSYENADLALENPLYDFYAPSATQE